MKTTGRPVIVFYPNKKLIKVYHSEMDPGLKRQLRCEFDSTPVSPIWGSFYDIFQFEVCYYKLVVVLALTQLLF